MKISYFYDFFFLNTFSQYIGTVKEDAGTWVPNIESIVPPLPEGGYLYFASQPNHWKSNGVRATTTGCTKNFKIKVHVAPLKQITISGNSNGTDQAASSKTVVAMQGQINSLQRTIIMQQVALEQRVRGEGGSGLNIKRAIKKGLHDYHDDSFSGTSIAAIHNHANNKRTVGMGEFSAVLNGVEFQTRHNDYALAQQSKMSKEGAKYGDMEAFPFPEVPTEVLKHPGSCSAADKRKCSLIDTSEAECKNAGACDWTPCGGNSGVVCPLGRCHRAHQPRPQYTTQSSCISANSEYTWTPLHSSAQGPKTVNVDKDDKSDGSGTWAITNYDELTINLGDSVKFLFSSGTHDVHQMESFAKYSSCDFTNAKLLSTEPYNFKPDAAGTYYIACSFTGHCAAGQKIKIVVKETSDTTEVDTSLHAITGTCTARFESTCNAEKISENCTSVSPPSDADKTGLFGAMCKNNPDGKDRTVAEQIKEMQEWFRAYKNQDFSVRDYRPYFPAVLCYVEGAWINDTTGLDEPFASDRHKIEADTWDELHSKTRYLWNSGRKNTRENLAFLPSALRRVGSLRNKGGLAPRICPKDYPYALETKNGSGIWSCYTTSKSDSSPCSYVGQESTPSKYGSWTQSHQSCGSPADPSSDIGKESNTHDTEYANWEYKIKCWILKDDVPLQRFRLRKNLQQMMRGRPSTRKELLHERSAHFEMNICNPDFYPNMMTDAVTKKAVQEKLNWCEGVVNYYDYLDKMMEQIPGKDGPGVFLSDSYEGMPALHTETGKTLNTAYYSRFYKIGENDAMGETTRRRGFNDAYMWAAQTTQPEVSELESKDVSTYGDKNSEYIAHQRWSYAIPLEIIYLNPLVNWNPYNIKDHGEDNKTDGYKAVSATTTRANGSSGPRNGRCFKNSDGSLDPAWAYNGTHRKKYYKTPIEFFSGGEGAVSAADTSGQETCVLDSNGKIQKVRASGHWITTPEIGGTDKDGKYDPVGILRQRYPIMPLHVQGSTDWKEIKALAEMTLPENFDSSHDGVFGSKRDEVYGFTLTLVGGGHEHDFQVDPKDLKKWNDGVDTIGIFTTDVRDLHQHQLNVKRTGVNPDYVYTIVTCRFKGEGKNDWINNNCADGHSLIVRY